MSIELFVRGADTPARGSNFLSGTALFNTFQFNYLHHCLPVLEQDVRISDATAANSLAPVTRAAAGNPPAAILVARCVVNFPHSFSQSSSDGTVTSACFE